MVNSSGTVGVFSQNLVFGMVYSKTHCWFQHASPSFSNWNQDQTHRENNPRILKLTFTHTNLNSIHIIYIYIIIILIIYISLSLSEIIYIYIICAIHRWTSNIQKPWSPPWSSPRDHPPYRRNSAQALERSAFWKRAPKSALCIV
jgi:hypothetical protein